MICKTPKGRRAAHTPAPEVHPSIPSITRAVCTGCGKVLSWNATTFFAAGA